MEKGKDIYDLSSLQENENKLDNQISELNRELEAERKRQEQIHKLIKSKKIDVDNLKNKCSELLAKKNDYNIEYQKILSSNSWGITRLLRKFSKITKLRSSKKINKGNKIKNQLKNTFKYHDESDPVAILNSITPTNVEQLKREYIGNGIDRLPDNYILYRIIGNDLYPRHKIGQSRENLQFILENEPILENCEKRWIVNRIIDKEEEMKIIKLLKKYNQEYIHIPFNFKEYKEISLDTDILPYTGYIESDEFLNLKEQDKGRIIAALYRLKNNYVMNNNGARNVALKEGKSQAKWVLPWDGNCFITENAWDIIRKGVREKEYLKYFVVPMARVTDNNNLLSNSYVPNPLDEPQLIFRKDSLEEFNEAFCYGRRPKVEMFWRLGIPGKWDMWKDSKWDQPRRPLSVEAYQFGVTGWVARLFSGMSSLEKDNRQRWIVRQEAIIETIKYVDKLAISSEFTDETNNPLSEVASAIEEDISYLKNEAQTAMKEKNWQKAILYWIQYIENKFTDIESQIEGHIGVYLSLIELNDINEATTIFQEKYLCKSNRKDLASTLKLFEKNINNTKCNEGLLDIIKNVQEIINDAGNTKVGWYFYFLGVLNQLIINNRKINRDEMIQVVISLVNKGKFAEALVFSPTPFMSAGYFSLIKYYLSLYHYYSSFDGKAILHQQIEKALISRMLSKFGEQEKASMLLKELITYDNIEIPDFFAELAYIYLLLERQDDAVINFKKCLEILKFNKRIRNEWAGTFNTLVYPYSTNATSREVNDYRKLESTPKKIFVSGFGWSGSGAVYDFFREYNQVSNKLPKEITLIEGKDGVGDIYKQFLKGNGILDKNLISLFAKHLFGFSCPESYQEARFSHKTKKMSINNKKISYLYSKIVHQFINDISPISTCNINSFVKSFNEFFNSLITIFSNKEYVLLDNVIKGYKMDLYNLIEDAHIFVVKRDPRSQFVANYYEHGKFSKNVDEFIGNYRSKQVRYAEQMSTLNYQHNNLQLELVQFEKFILSEDYRNELAMMIGLDVNNRNMHMHFKPWESEKNIVNYRDFPYQEDIKKIERELNEYLYEI